MTRMFQDGFDHIGGGSFSFRSRHTDDRNLLRRVIVPGRRDKRHGIPGILHPDDCHAVRHLHLFGNYQHSGSLLRRLGGKLMSICHGTRDTEKQAARRDLPGIVHNIRHFCVNTALYACIGNPFQ